MIDESFKSKLQQTISFSSNYISIIYKISEKLKKAILQERIYIYIFFFRSVTIEAKEELLLIKISIMLINLLFFRLWVTGVKEQVLLKKFH